MSTFTAEPVIDLTRGESRESLLLNVQAELQIMENRDRALRRRQHSMGELLVDAGYDYLPGVGWHVPFTTPGRKTQPEVKHEPVRWHGDFAAADDGFDDSQGVYTAVFTDVRTGAQTYVCDDGTVPIGNVLEEVNRRYVRPAFASAPTSR